MAAVTRFARRWRGDERGAELIEMAIVTPILLLILAGIFDFGMLFRTWQAVTNAAREGARVAVLPGYEATDIEARVDAYIGAAGVTGSYLVDVDDQTVATGAGTITVRAVTVTLTQPLTFLGTFGAFFGSSFTTVPVRARATMRTETQAAP